MLTSIATYVLFGNLCVVNPQDPTKWPYCMSFWQDPIIHYKTPKECKKAANKKAKLIKETYDFHELKLHSLEITCISTGNDIRVDKNHKIIYNIL